MESFPWLLRSYHELWLTALALGSAFRAHGTWAVKIRKVTLGERLLRCSVALSAITDAQSCFRECSSGIPNSRDCFQDGRWKMIDKSKGFNRKGLSSAPELLHCEIRLFH